MKNEKCRDEMKNEIVERMLELQKELLIFFQGHNPDLASLVALMLLSLHVS